MQTYLQHGRDGERIAVQLLKARGYQVLCSNWRYKHLEIDVIAREGNQLVFVEVKTRSSDAFGLPFEAVDWKKQERLARAAERYIAAHQYHVEIRFDVVSILYSERDQTYRTQLIKDAVWPE